MMHTYYPYGVSADKSKAKQFDVAAHVNETGGDVVNQRAQGFVAGYGYHVTQGNFRTEHVAYSDTQAIRRVPKRYENAIPFESTDFARHPTYQGTYPHAVESSSRASLKYPKLYHDKESMSMMNIVREVYQEASDTFRTLVRVSKTTPALLRNLKEFQEGCKEYLKNRELTISLIPVDKFLDHIRQYSIEVLEKNRVALGCFLRFTLNLCTEPTREEYHLIKKYTAFFQCNIDGIFSFADDVLSLIGYKPYPEADEYRLDKIPDNLIEVAFNLFLTTIEFERVIEFAKDARKEGFSVSDCLQARKDINESMSGWTSLAGLKWLKEKETLEKKAAQRELDDGFSKSSDPDRVKFSGSQYSASDTSGYRYSQDSGSDSYKYSEGSSTRDGNSKFSGDVQERSWTDANRSYSPMRGKEQFYSGDRRPSDNNYQGSGDNYKGSMFLDNRNDISDHDLYGDSHDGIGNDSKERTISPSSSLVASGGRLSTEMKGNVDVYGNSQYTRVSEKQQYLGLSDERSRDSETVEKLTSGRVSNDLKGNVDVYGSSQYGRVSDKQQYIGMADERSRDSETLEKLSSGRVSADLKGSVDIYNNSQYGRVSDKQQYLGIADERSRESETVEKLTSASNYTLDKSSRDFIPDSDSRTSTILPSKDTVITSRVPSDRMGRGSTTVTVQRKRGTSSDVISDSQTSAAVLFSDKTKDIVTYDTSNCDSSSSKANFRAYEQSTAKKSDRSGSSYGKSSDSSLYSQSVTGQRYLQGDVVSDVTREPAIYRSNQTRGKTEICARGVNDFTNLPVPSIYKP